MANGLVNVAILMFFSSILDCNGECLALCLDAVRGGLNRRRERQTAVLRTRQRRNGYGNRSLGSVRHRQLLAHFLSGCRGRSVDGRLRGSEFDEEQRIRVSG